MVSVHKLSEADFAKALLPRVVKGNLGQKVVCHDEWMWREKYESEKGDKPAIHAELEAKFSRKPPVPKHPAPR
jgi:hypothetical protein